MCSLSDRVSGRLSLTISSVILVVKTYVNIDVFHQVPGAKNVSSVDEVVMRGGYVKGWLSDGATRVLDISTFVPRVLPPVATDE